MRFNSLGEIELEYHRDPSPKKDAYIPIFEKALKSQKRVKCDKLYGFNFDAYTAIGINQFTSRWKTRHVRLYLPLHIAGIMA